MRLDRLLEDVEVMAVRGDLETTDVSSVTYDSTAARPGSLFCCLPGDRADGHEFAHDAVAAGAVAVLGERTVDLDVDVTQAVVSDSRAAMAQVAAAFFGHPSRSLDVVGVTGTNGKTTTAHLIKSILDEAGRPTDQIGTMTGARTTPEAPELQALLAAARDAGRVAVAIEVSSVGLVKHRVDAVRFAAGVFTNLSPDELGIHGTVEAYFAAKASLFTPERIAVAILNADDEYGQRLIGSVKVPVRTFSLDDASSLVVGDRGSRFVWKGHPVELALPGTYNVTNALAAATAAHVLGVDAEVVAAALSRSRSLPGHSEVIDAGQDFTVVVDFAHTGGALAAVLDDVRRLHPNGRVIAVFGSGGDRDRSRRAFLGQAAAHHADLAVVTSDNPRHEDPARILADVVAGMEGGPAQVITEVDRRKAIALALAEARAGDVIVIAGKGYETGQIVGDQVLPFDDREVVRELLA